MSIFSAAPVSARASAAGDGQQTLWLHLPHEDAVPLDLAESWAALRVFGTSMEVIASSFPNHTTTTIARATGLVGLMWIEVQSTFFVTPPTSSSPFEFT